MSEKILVTGASGFLGGRLVQMLVESGASVRAFVRATSDRSHLDGLDIEFAEGALTDRSSLDRAMEGITRVFNCAGMSADWGRWEDFFAANVAGVENVLEAAAAAGTVTRVVHVSTTDVYGYPEIPCAETYGPHDVGYPYNRSKGMGDRIALDFSARRGLPVTVVRPVSIFGPRSKDFVVEIGTLLVGGEMMTVSGGTSPAGLVYVDDVVQAMMALADAPEAAGQAFNVRDPSKMDWRTYIDKLADGMGVKRAKMNFPSWLAMGVGRAFELAYGLVKAESRPLLTRHAVALLYRDQAYPIDKLQKTVGYTPAVGVDAGIERTIEWLHTDEGKEAVPR